MQRRNFLTNSAILGGGLALGFPFSAFSNEGAKDFSKNKFNLLYAPHEGMFANNAGKNVLDQLRFIAKMGFRAFEDNEMRQRPVSEQEEMADLMQKLEIRMGVFVAHTIHWKEPNLTSGSLEKRREFLAEIKASVAVAKRLNAKWITVVPGHVDLSKSHGLQMSNVIKTLRAASEIFEKNDLIMVLEPLNKVDHPGMFLEGSPQAYEICSAVNSPSCKMLFDIYHQQITEGNLIPNIASFWDEIAYFQIGDNPGRNEPTTGEINYKNIFKYIHSRGYKGILGMEHGNSISGEKGENALIDAYISSDKFL